MVFKDVCDDFEELGLIKDIGVCVCLFVCSYSVWICHTLCGLLPVGTSLRSA